MAELETLSRCGQEAVKEQLRYRLLEKQMRGEGFLPETIVSIALAANSVQAEPRLEKNVVYGMYSVWRCLWTCHYPDKLMAMGCY